MKQHNTRQQQPTTQRTPQLHRQRKVLRLQAVSAKYIGPSFYRRLLMISKQQQQQKHQRTPRHNHYQQQK